MIRHISSILLLISLSICVGQVNLGQGSYNPNAPGPASNEGPFVTSNFSKPIITTDWWTSILWSKWQNPQGYSNILHPHPWSMRCFSGGLSMGYANVPSIYNGNAGTSFDNIYNHFYEESLSVGIEGVIFNQTQVEDYTDWDVLANWQSGNDVLKARMGHGFVYTYFTKQSDNPLKVTSLGNVSVKDNILLVSHNGKNFAVFAPSGSSWAHVGDGYVSDLSGKEYCSVALLPDSSLSTLSEYELHAYAFVTSTISSYNNTNDGQLITNFNLDIEVKEGIENTTLLALYRHQWLHTLDVNTSFVYSSPRGLMKVVKSFGFQTVMNNIGSLPLLPLTSSLKQSGLPELVAEFANRPVYNCQGQGCLGGYYGNYTMGRFLIQAGQVALIADQLGDMVSRDKIVNWIKYELEDYFIFSGDNRHVGYNDDWNITLLNSDNIEHCSVDCLNDRHIQYGYWVRAAAIVEQFNPGWASSENFGGMVDLLIRDVACTDRNDEMFPFMRNFDVYAGHSWALGFSDLSEGADQESSSESINFASALIYYGQVTGDKALIDQGQWMYTTEVIATEQYWFDVDEEVFPQDFYPEMLGLTRSSGGFYQLWWQLLPEHVLMVNCFPWTGGALYLGRHPEGCRRVYEWIESGAGQNGIQKWQGYLWPYLALYDPVKAINEYESTTYDYSIELEAEANNYYWLYALKDLGTINNEVYSGVSSVVFDKGDERKYAVYTSSNWSEKIVSFSDGAQFLVPSDTLILFSEADLITGSTEPDDLVNHVFELFPTVVEDFLTIRENEPRETAVKVEVIDGFGRVVFSQKMETDNLNLSHLSTGFYLVKVANGRETEEFKIERR